MRSWTVLVMASLEMLTVHYRARGFNFRKASLRYHQQTSFADSSRYSAKQMGQIHDNVERRLNIKQKFGISHVVMWTVSQTSETTSVLQNKQGQTSGVCAVEHVL